jgi:hypothetical protein
MTEPKCQMDPFPSLASPAPIFLLMQQFNSLFFFTLRAKEKEKEKKKNLQHPFQRRRK